MGRAIASPPIRVCDDGRWNGKCYQPGDGGPVNLTRADCTSCAFGSVAVVVLANLEPPVISLGGDNGVYDVEPGEDVELNLSGSRDPEGVLGNLMDSNGLAFTYTVQGQGEIVPTPGFENDPNNLGPRPTYVPAGDGDRVDTITVRVRDAGQMESTAQIRVRVANTPPVVDEWTVSFVPTPIIADTPILENLGNRRYRLTIDAGPDPGWDAYIDHRTSEPYNEPVTVSADFSGDGQPDL